MTDQTDLKNALDLKANSSEIPTDLSELSNTTTKFVNETELASAISALGNVFTLKGSVPNVASLPATGNKQGDVYYVQSESAGYVWINDNGTLRWELLGMTVDISTTEKVVGTYFGKPLYEKTLNFGTLTQTGSTISLSHNVANVAIPVWARGYFRGTNDNYPLPFGNHDTSINRITTGSIQMNNTQNWTGWTLYVDFYYTKTTD